jgi:large subunit ribosomal protein L25
MFEIKAEIREIVGKKVNSLRRSGIIPAILYGHGKKPVNLSVNAKDFSAIFKKAGETSLVELVVGGKKHNVLVHDLARNPLTDETIHIDFFEVRMDEKIKTKVPLVFVGESLAIKSDGGVLVRALQEVEIEALPKDLPKEIVIDISPLKTFEDKLLIKNIVMAGSIKILAGQDDVVALVAPPRSDKEMEDLEGKAEVAAPEEIKVAGEEKKAEEVVEE